jgi:hypothetical protein
LFAPAILVWKKASIPYLAAAASHSLVGDYLTRSIKERGVQLLFPLSSTWFSAGFKEAELMYVYSEMIIFIAFLSLLLATRDIKDLTKVHPSNFLLIIPILTAALPVFIEFPVHVPLELVIPHLALISLLTIPILVDLRSYIRKAIPRRA